ncbi:hypothetical protein ABZP36_028814 [Zizania latifolia]
MMYSPCPRIQQFLAVDTVTKTEGEMTLLPSRTASAATWHRCLEPAAARQSPGARRRHTPPPGRSTREGSRWASPVACRSPSAGHQPPPGARRRPPPHSAAQIRPLLPRSARPLPSPLTADRRPLRARPQAPPVSSAGIFAASSAGSALLPDLRRQHHRSCAPPACSAAGRALRLRALPARELGRLRAPPGSPSAARSAASSAAGRALRLQDPSPASSAGP